MDVTALVGIKPNIAIPDFGPGDTVRVSIKIKEGEQQRSQVFQGVVIRIRKGGAGASFTVRRVTYGIGVERTFLFCSPLLDKVEVVRHGKVRRAKLYYLRGLSGKASRIKERSRVKVGEVVEQPSPAEEMGEPAKAQLAGETAEQAKAEVPGEPKEQAKAEGAELKEQR